MENSILRSTKKILGIDPLDNSFDVDIITHINAVFSVLTQLGIEQDEGFLVSSDDEHWEEFQVPENQLNLIRTYMYLKVRMLFDPPTTSFHIDAMNNQAKELEWRLSVMRESALPILLEEEIA